MKKSSIVLAVALALAGCATRHSIQLSEVIEGGTPRVIKAPGVVESVWEEPMVDVVDVPPGLDPEGHYYRPAHKEVVEVRQGRYRYLRDGESR